jgi:hypothetical protein
MEFDRNLREAVIAKTLRVPATDSEGGDSSALARQLDVALVSAGFKCSGRLLTHVSTLGAPVAQETGTAILRAVRELVGDHVQHNAYFIDFPDNVPDTADFWSQCVARALLDPRSAGNVAAQLASGWVNLLDLPAYGTYQHTYEEMLAAHDEFVASAKDRVTLLELGQSLAQDSHALYLSLATSPVPLSESDLALLAELAELHVADRQPDKIDVRENRAAINRVRLANGLPLLVDTPIDLLRLACATSDGDVTLSTPTRFSSFSRGERRALMAALEDVVRSNPAKLGDVRRYSEQIKRLGERLHPHEYPEWEAAQDVFAVARGERRVRSLAGRVELALAAGKTDEALAALAHAPGVLLRSVDRLARAGADVDRLALAVREATPSVSTRILFSVREHLLNRKAPAVARIFVNQHGRSWVTSDKRTALPERVAPALGEALDAELASRLPTVSRLVVDPRVRTLAIPLSEKTRPHGLGVMPRGSVQELDEHVRFFVYWKEHERRTDFDLSVLLLDDEFQAAGHVSWTNLKDHGAVHSGDITRAPNGATEFIDMDLGRVSTRYVVPQVNVYSGEGFNRVEETFFGFMQREPAQKGRPFEPRTVRAKSDLSGSGRVSLPVIFARTGQGNWEARWMHLNLFGHPLFNQVEANYRGTSLLVRGIIEHEYLRMSYLEDLFRGRGVAVDEWPSRLDPDQPIMYLGLDRPEGLPAGSTVITLANLTELLSPA